MACPLLQSVRNGKLQREAKSFLQKTSGLVLGDVVPVGSIVSVVQDGIRREFNVLETNGHIHTLESGVDQVQLRILDRFMDIEMLVEVNPNLDG